MIKIYSMPTCPDCQAIEEQIEGNLNFQIIDIGSHVKHMKEFLRLRDTHPVFEKSRREGYVGIPCFILEDGTITLKPKDVGLVKRSDMAQACGIDGKGC